ncbi:MAG: Fic family protein [Actinobacteria bacterium]|nr:Fic family protein [Actinomycetota bacterium]
MASAYLYYIARDHPFVDGNKRTGAIHQIPGFHALRRGGVTRLRMDFLFL